VTLLHARDALQAGGGGGGAMYGRLDVSGQSSSADTSDTATDSQTDRRLMHWCL